jgi:chemotaxis protein CheD
MFPDCLKTNTNQIGLRNVLLAQGLLTSLGLELTTQHIGGAGYRAIVFDVWSGEVRVRYQCLNSGETTETKKATQ